MKFKTHTNVSANYREVRFRQQNLTAWLGSASVCLNSKGLLHKCSHIKNFPLAIMNGNNSQQLPRRVKLILSMRDCKSVGRVQHWVQPDSNSLKPICCPVQFLFLGNAFYNLENREWSVGPKRKRFEHDPHFKLWKVLLTSVNLIHMFEQQHTPKALCWVNFFRGKASFFPVQTFEFA